MGRIVLCALAFVIVLSAMAIGTVDRAAASDLRAASEIAREYVKGHVQQLGLAASDITEVVLSSEVVSRDTGITHVYLEQRYRGIEVYAGILTLSLRPDGGVLSARSRFVSNLAAATDGQAPKISAIEAATAVAESLDLNPTSDFRLVSQTNGADMASTISDGGIALVGEGRELEAVIRRAVTETDQPVLRADGLQLSSKSLMSAPMTFKALRANLAKEFEQREREFLDDLLRCNDGNISKAARVAYPVRELWLWSRWTEKFS